MQIVHSITRNFINLVWPLHCAICKKDLDPLDDLHVCKFCIDKVRRNPKPYCRICGRALQNAKDECSECRRTSFYFERACSACLYEGALKDLIHLFKYKGKRSLEKILAKFMIDFVKENIDLLGGVDIITFVPIQHKRLIDRGFNQSKVLASNLSNEFKIPLLDTLKKTRSTKAQNDLKRSERLVNLKGAFKVRGGAALKERCILLIDDVMTTSATLNECSKTLLDSGAKKVKCLTLARGN